MPPREPTSSNCERWSQVPGRLRREGVEGAHARAAGRQAAPAETWTWGYQAARKPTVRGSPGLRTGTPSRGNLTAALSQRSGRLSDANGHPGRSGSRVLGAAEVTREEGTREEVGAVPSVSWRGPRETEEARRPGTCASRSPRVPEGFPRAARHRGPGGPVSCTGFQRSRSSPAPHPLPTPTVARSPQGCKPPAKGRLMGLLSLQRTC
ncbi:collagen alpha-2(I) chain-like isoform X2 [Suricata suricatta]|uniref:collagen alpha-2(I) chain-like isoform X2 n=1 Tax=Suricata suricatta TaxID=37032 RepID=UPI00115530DC|nr:collagen alpha-2(I) chain-like isoform X2 [Suricata suricatta]